MAFQNFSERSKTRFGVPQGSILGPLIFNIYVSDLQSKVDGQCFQYADDTTLLHHSSPQDLQRCAHMVNRDIEKLIDYSQNSNLALNSN